MDITKISQLNPIGNERQLNMLSEDNVAGPSFSEMLKSQVSDVDAMLKESDKKASELALGKTENLHEAMIATEKAETALKFLVQVRNKAIDAYHEIMRMQV